MSKNGNRILALYDGMTTFYGLLDLFKPNGQENIIELVQWWQMVS